MDLNFDDSGSRFICLAEKLLRNHEMNIDSSENSCARWVSIFSFRRTHSNGFKNARNGGWNEEIFPSEDSVDRGLPTSGGTLVLEL